jgi:hypothetical protein
MIVLGWVAALAAAPAWAGDTFSIDADLGGAGRWLDNQVLDDPAGFGLSLGVGLELDSLLKARADVRYVEGKIFDPAEDRFVDVSAALSSPAIAFLCADVHEIYARSTARPADGLFYMNGGLGFRAKILGTLKGGVGVSYLSAPSRTPDERTSAIGAYLGAEYLLRTRHVDLSVRLAPLLVFHEAKPTFALTSDADLMVKFPVGAAYLGPRLDVSFRDFALTPASEALFGQPREFTGSLGLGVYWGAGGG